jgi:hypothetical protein
MGLDPDLLHGVGRRRIEARRLVEVREHGAVQREQVVIGVPAVHRHDRPLAAVRRILVRPDVGDAGVDAGQGDHVAAVHGQVLHPLVVDQVGVGRRTGLHHRRRRPDLHLRRQAADREDEVQAHVRPRRQLEIAARLGLEAAGFDLDLVRASRQGQQVEEPRRIRPGRADQLLTGRSHGDGGVADHAAARIPHVSADRAADLGRRRGGTEDQQREDQTR